jgi:hypothetical protein
MTFLASQRALNRRASLKLGIASITAVWIPGAIATEAPPAPAEKLRRFDRLFSSFLSQEKSIANGRRFREGLAFFSPFAPGIERAPSRAKPSSTPISTRATQLVVACEVSNKSTYIRRYRHPTWPQGDSGVTIGIGYDVGYVTREWLRDDWGEFIPDDQIIALRQACGATGERAHKLTVGLHGVDIGWDQAYKQFLVKVQPRWIGETEVSLPNTSSLSADSLGALVSLVYNRGPSFDAPFKPDQDPIDRYREMRNIKRLMGEKRLAAIPEQLRAMKRIWKGKKGMEGLLTRRELEATLFEAGLQSKPV